MRIDLTVCGTDGGESDVAVFAAGPVPFDEVSAALRVALGPTATASGWCTGGRPVGAAERLGGPGLRTGDRLTPAPATVEASVRRVDVVGGVDAGTSLLGSRRTVVIGRDPQCDLHLRDPDVSRRHAELSFTTSGIVVRDLGSTHGTAVGGAPVSGRTIWDPQQLLRIGDTHLAQRGTGDGPASTRATPDGTIEVRPRQLAPPPPPLVLDVPLVPTTVPATSATWSAAIVPAVAGVGLAVWTGSPAFLALALLSPLALAATIAVDRFRGRRRNRRAGEQAGAASERAAAEVARALREETVARRRAFPDAAAVLAIARGPSDRLWERTPADLLRVRVGLADQPSQVRTKTAGRVEPAGVVASVPAVIELADGPVGLVGPRDTIRGVARWLLGQLAIFASPADVRIEVHANAEADATWQWLRWLPHLHPATTVAAASPPVVIQVYDELISGPVSTPAICLAENRSDLPPGCTQVISVANESGTRLERDGLTILTDAVDIRWAERVARAIAPLTPAPTQGGVLPAECRLPDVLGPADPRSIRTRWAGSDGGAAAAIGVGPAGRFVLDLDRHGPHALIAGTTGSGKSQLLRTLVAALAGTHPPDQLSFVLIDYKGGSAFADCASLPHVVGSVTDLDEHLTARALASLHSELRRRERLFAAAAVPDLAGYRACGATPPLPRLMIVVDEYATLAAELPGFVAGLTGIAQRGRSLGLHLVLATQRPAGVVTADVRANCSLRIALRVTDVGDSQDVVDGPEAAAIPQDLPGRAYVWTDGAVRPVQVARTDLPDVSDAPPGVQIRALGPWRSLDASAADRAERSELAAFVAAVTEAASGHRPVAAPWLPPLPDSLALGDLPPPRHEGTATIGLVDLPGQQSRQPLVLDLRSGCSVLVAGAPRSGRTTTLVTIALAAADRHPPDQLQIHAIDLLGELGAGLDGLPHRGTVVTPATGIELADALLRELERGRDEPMPSILLLDGWDAFARASEDWDGGASSERLLSLVRAGQPGRTIAISGDRSALAPRLAGAVTTRLLLRLPDRTDYALAGIPLGAVPRTAPPGRILLAPDGTEAQIAHAGVEPSRTAFDAAVRAIAGRATRTQPALCLRPLPADVDVSELPPPDDIAPFAVAAPRCRPIGLPFTQHTRLLVAGPARSGRSTALATLLHQAVRAGHRATVVAPARSPVRASAVRLGVAVLDPTGDPAAVERVGGVLLVDDVEDFADSPLDEVLARRARQSASAMVVCARIEDAARAYRGLVLEIRRSRCALLLQPGPLDGELVGLRLRSGVHGGPPGRGVLIGDPAWGTECADGPVRVQVARAA